MASLITCPHCGVRPKEEFSIRGDASPIRPAPGAPDDDWVRYVFIRDNPKGRIVEHWHHSSGCRRWLVVERDNAGSHEVYSVTDASDYAKEAAR
ncbi:sarcosine oxidase subunit delta [Rhizobium sp. Root274]|uniref:sarcosine oxidase subunit delta n=1 Tax=unclassified Rhizobium TaxID=2613769 RepID=UPI000716029F|nr:MULTISPECIES: sarcosine oxidase subunit delta [unclassified Rhizobium]KQW29195.1 sarcosine oxidase subunit delta [Rhizobium sp. Root1240]KRD29391.1 sarcosine oxidase subunit delta [Rhizobium sp. Root274]